MIWLLLISLIAPAVWYYGWLHGVGLGIGLFIAEFILTLVVLTPFRSAFNSSPVAIDRMQLAAHFVACIILAVVVSRFWPAMVWAVLVFTALQLVSVHLSNRLLRS